MGGQCPTFHISECFHIKRLACTYGKWEMLNLLGLSLRNFNDFVCRVVTMVGCYSHVLAYSNIYYENFLNTIQAKYWLDMIVINSYMHGTYGLKCELYNCCRILACLCLKLLLGFLVLTQFRPSLH
jgi:hypothetical protein